MSNVSEENAQVQTDRRQCPQWCVHHDRMDVGSPDEVVIHYGSVREVGEALVQLSQLEFSDGEREQVFVRLNDVLIPVAEAALLGTVLSSLSADAVVR